MASVDYFVGGIHTGLWSANDTPLAFGVLAADPDPFGSPSLFLLPPVRT